MITLIFCGDLRYCPYIKRYTERLDKKGHKYEVLFWNRAGLRLDLPKNYYCYNIPSSESLDKLKKLIDFWGFRKWVISHLKTHSCDGLILLSTLTAVLLSNKLKIFSHRYIFDIRDYSYENIRFFRIIESTIIKNSFFTAISSKGFKKFLPKYDYVIAHNFNRNEIPDLHYWTKKEFPLKLVWNGTVRFFDFQKHYLDELKNDNRFIMVYHGTGTDLEKYKKYCEKENIKNVEFTGAYDNKDKEKLLKDAAILNNSYGGREGDELRYAVSNRYYDGLIYRIPQLVEAEGYKASITESNKVGIALDANGYFADKLASYYVSINEIEFNQDCEAALDLVLNEDNNYINSIDKFINEIEERGQNEKNK